MNMPFFLKHTLVESYRVIRRLMPVRIHFGRVSDAAGNGLHIVLLPIQMNTFHCGLSGMIAFHSRQKDEKNFDPESFKEMTDRIISSGAAAFDIFDDAFAKSYLAGTETVQILSDMTERLKDDANFIAIYNNQDSFDFFSDLSSRLLSFFTSEEKWLAEQTGYLSPGITDSITRRVEKLKDIKWALKEEVLDNVRKVRSLSKDRPQTDASIAIYKKINSVLNSIDRLEVRGRDSAGISILFIIEKDTFSSFEKDIESSESHNMLQNRLGHAVLMNNTIRIHHHEEEKGKPVVSIAFTYKIAAEIGRLGDNIRFIREEIQKDDILNMISHLSHRNMTISSHTRWASIGAITVPNCHPIDNETLTRKSHDRGIIHACLNGDIDNYLSLKETLLDLGTISDEVTTDTKVIPLQIQQYIMKGHSIEEAFRLSVNDFEGSHAIAMHTSLSPGKFYLAQRGSGQAIFVGLSDHHYMPSSEVYGFVEETGSYLKLDGEKTIDGKRGKTNGQIFILDQNSEGGLSGIHAMYYDGTKISLSSKDIKKTQITSRDIDRQNFPHYFLKEISESPVSVERTIHNRWKIKNDDFNQMTLVLSEKEFPRSLERAIQENRLKRIYFVGQGTAGIAAQACSDILSHYLDDTSIFISALKASELSGFKLGDSSDRKSMEDSLVVAITQSGTTTDTNRAIDMVRERGAFTLAIVNRRDSDITFKVDGVIYTSSGRDIEMSVASTKAFYSQIIAGALLALKVAELKKSRSEDFISKEIQDILKMPNHMRQILSQKDAIKKSAIRSATKKNYWAVVGSGPNKASADEIRIKLSELCYKTISSDYIEDKKHIDLSSEPLIIVCAAGSRSTVIGDIIKDTAIFKAHKATPIIIADEGEDRFLSYAEDLFHVPVVSSHLAPILNTLVGHLWGYYAALSINEGSSFLNSVRTRIQTSIDRFLGEGHDIYDAILENSFRETILELYYQFRKRINEKTLPTSIARASDLTLLFKYLIGRLPTSDFEIDFGKKGTASNIVNTLFEFLGDAINQMARPIDAIKHQAKTVTVGTSRIMDRIEGLLFDTLADHHFKTSQLTYRNIAVLKNLRPIVSKINGTILYKIDGLNLMGEPTENTTIHVLQKTGMLLSLSSRVENDPELKGTKRIIVEKGNVYIGKGRKDGRNILIIPLISGDSVGIKGIYHLLLLNISFNENVELAQKIKALGGKYDHIKSIVQESNIRWNDDLLNTIELEELFGRSAEKIGEDIVNKENG